METGRRKEGQWSVRSIIYITFYSNFPGSHFLHSSKQLYSPLSSKYPAHPLSVILVAPSHWRHFFLAPGSSSLFSTRCLSCRSLSLTPSSLSAFFFVNSCCLWVFGASLSIWYNLYSLSFSLSILILTSIPRIHFPSSIIETPHVPSDRDPPWYARSWATLLSRELRVASQRQS